MEKEDIDNRFRFHSAPDEEKRNAHSAVRGLYADLAHQVNERLPEGREKSLAITKLEEAMFWSNAALARRADSA